MSFDEKQYHRLLEWADDRLKKWSIPNLTGIDLIHDAWLMTGGNGMNENQVRKKAEKILNDEVRHSLSTSRILNGFILMPPKKNQLLIPEEKTCSKCKQQKSQEEFKLVKEKYLSSYCNGCRAVYSKLYKQKKYVSKKKYRLLDTATGKKYYSLREACNDMGLKFSTVQNYFGKKGPKNKTTLKLIGK